MKLGIPQPEGLVRSLKATPAELGFQIVVEDLIAVGPAAIVTTVAVYR
ncbi:MAG: hypothetical protein H5T84_10440 [Thermoleophilia bacterium]|nr:hypothetical protein [Thermoleophilia bacterium]